MKKSKPSPHAKKEYQCIEAKKGHGHNKRHHAKCKNGEVRWGKSHVNIISKWCEHLSSLPSGKYQYIDVALHCVSNDNTQPSHWRGMYTGSILSSSPKQDIIGHQIFICLIPTIRKHPWKAKRIFCTFFL